MTPTRTAGASLTLLAVLTGCSMSPAPAPASPPSAVHRVAVTLNDSPAARQLAGMLPLTVDLKDVWGQAKSGRLPQPLTVEGAVAVHDPVPGQFYFWPQSSVIAFYYEDLGQAVPDPGLVRLGTVDDGVEEIAGLGRRASVRIEPGG